MSDNGVIEGVILRDLTRYSDQRGWLMELFRTDEITAEINPAMSYISMTVPGVARGPHEHVEQTDYFCFAGPSTFKVYLWDGRKDSSTYQVKQVVLAGEEDPKVVIVPPGVIHAYKNVGTTKGLVVNFPNRLFMGEGKNEAIDEIRYEDLPDSPYVLD
ncbi:MAG: dTDP-4-dehydrorhamnose 3,5-epimerase family protein [Thermodesulfobacteriota bacterium]